LFIKFVVKVTVCLALASGLTASLIAQETTAQQTTTSEQTTPSSAAQTQSQDAGKTPQTSQEKDKQNSDKNSGKVLNQGKIAGTSNDRLFYTLPNFLTLENAGNVPPLTTKQKYGVVARSAFDPIVIPWYGAIAAGSQAQNSEPGFGQGWGAYGKRFAAAFSDGCIENFMVGAVFPSFLHEDPRFFQKGHGGFFHRTFYAASRMVITRTDSGHEQFNFSEIVGSAASSVISTYSYHPKGGYVSTPSNPHFFIPSDRTVKNTAAVWGTQVGYDTFTVVVKEFWPDIHRKISPKYRRESAEAQRTSSRQQ
jgi:hypothetical protein